MDSTEGILFFIFLSITHQATSSLTKENLTFVNTQMTWNEAYQHCKNMGMDLLEIENSAEQYFVEQHITQWNTIGPIWIGLHKVDIDDPLIIKWSSDCSDYQSFNKFSTGFPSPNVDDSFCFALNRITAELYSAKCDMKMQSVCQQNAGQCTFSLTPGKGCNHDVKETSEVNLEQCLEECRSGVNSNNLHCWGVGFWEGYSGDDCWKFFSEDPEICIKKMASYAPVVLGIKQCFEVGTDTTATSSPNLSILPYTVCTNWTQSTTVEAPTTVEVTTGIASTTTEQLTFTTTEQETTSLGTETVSTTSSTALETTSEKMSNTTTDTYRNSSNCICTCSSNNTVYDVSEEEFQKLLRALTVNRKETSKHKRSLISAEDNRTSAKTIGYFGIFFLVFTFGSIVALDLPVLINSVRRLMHLNM